MMLSNRVKNTPASITLKLNALAEELTKSGKRIYNLTAGQLPNRPPQGLVHEIEKQTKFLKSFQYSPVRGFPELNEKFITHVENTRGVELPREKFDCIISNGAKNSVFNLLGALINDGDEVIVMAPYWISYPHMIQLWEGVPKVIDVHGLDFYLPHIDDIRKMISPRTKAIIVNSPNNPTGIYYDEEWMKDFANLMVEHPHVSIVSDEIYYHLNYFDPKPTYFYQYKPELLDRTFIIDGISKSFASTGLRIGFVIGDEKIIKGMGKIQGQMSSGANSLIQKALIEYDFSNIDEDLAPTKNHLRENANFLRDALSAKDLSKAWYQINSAFYFFLNFQHTPILSKFQKDADDNADYSAQICEQILEETGIVIVPGEDFGMPNSARVSICTEKSIFEEAVGKLLNFIS